MFTCFVIIEYQAGDEAKTFQINLTDSDMKNVNFNENHVHCYEDIHDNLIIE